MLYEGRNDDESSYVRVLASEATVLCPPQLNQLVVVEYLTTQDWRGQVEVFKDLYRERRDAMLDALTQLMPEGTTWITPAKPSSRSLPSRKRETTRACSNRSNRPW